MPSTRRAFSAIAAWVPAGLWYAVIWGFSAQTAEASGQLSGRLLYRLLAGGSAAFRAQDEAGRYAIVEFLSFYERKAAHMFLYFVLAGLVLFALGRLIPGPGWRAAGTLAVCGVLAGLDEFHQTFVPGRSGQAGDVCVDLAGCVCLVLLWRVAAWAVRGARAGRRRPTD